MYLTPEEAHRLEMVALTERAVASGDDDAGFNAVVHLGRGNRIEQNDRSRIQTYNIARGLYRQYRRQAMVYCWSRARWAHVTNIGCEDGSNSIQIRDSILSISQDHVERFDTVSELLNAPSAGTCCVVFLGFDNLCSIWKMSLADQRRTSIMIKQCLGDCPDDPVAIWRKLVSKVKLRRTR